WPSQSRKICLQQVGARRGVAKVCRKWAISGCAGGGRHTVGSAPDDKSFHSIANRRDECTMVPFLRPKRKFRLKSLGFSTNKSQTLIDVSSAIRDRCLNLESLVKLDNQAALEQLVKLKGVGRWTAEYVLLRGLGRLDIFPGDDVGARKKLAHFLRKKKPLDYDGVRRAVASWQPYAGLVYFHL